MTAVRSKAFRDIQRFVIGQVPKEFTLPEPRQGTLSRSYPEIPLPAVAIRHPTDGTPHYHFPATPSTYCQLRFVIPSFVIPSHTVYTRLCLKTPMRSDWARNGSDAR